MISRSHYLLPCGASLVLLLAGLPTSLPAQPPPPPPPIRLKVQPAASPKPALKYKLLPELGEKTPGNAALLYLRAFSPEWYSHKRLAGYPGFLEFTKTPLATFPKKDLTWLLDYGPLKQLDKAARKETCDWEMTSRVREEGMTMLVPEMQGFRELAALIALRTRLLMAEGKLDQAVESLQTGFSMGRDIGQSPFLVNYLIGVAISMNMINQLEELIQQPKSPNFYWALGYLPNPFIDFRSACEGERMTLFATIPELSTIESEILTPEKEEKLLNQLYALERSLGNTQSTREEYQFDLTALALKVYPQAKKSFIEEGRKAEEVETMPVLQIVTIYSLRQFKEHQDEVFKWLMLPIPEARVGLEQAEKRLRIAQAKRDNFPLCSLIPGLAKVYDAPCRLSRRIAALRCLEAIRMHAKENKGKPPAKLEDVNLVPVPMDPVTGQSFEYFVKGQVIILKAPPPVSKAADQSNSFSYEMTIDS
jgi:hypothetical protein